MLDTLTTSLTKAGAQALDFFNSLGDRAIEAKAPGDLVSDTDRAVEATLRRLRSQHFPDCGILGGELGGDATGRFWTVDPIDGTANILSCLPFWTISLGLMDNGLPIAGGILARNRHGSRIPRQRSPCIGLGRNPRWPAADRHATEAAIADAGLGPRRFGSCALSLMLVATGRLKG